MNFQLTDGRHFLQRFKHFALCALVLMWAVAGCSKNPQQGSEQQAVLATLEKNTRATQNENIEEYMSTIHPDSALYNSTKAILPTVFANTNVNYSVLDSKVESITDTEAVLHYTLLSESVVKNDPKFRNNKIRQTMTMRKHNGEWKLYGGKIEKIEYVN